MDFGNYIDNNGVLHHIVNLQDSQPLGNNHIQMVNRTRIVFGDLQDQSNYILTDNGELFVLKGEQLMPLLDNLQSIKDYLGYQNIIILLSDDGEVILYNITTQQITTLEVLSRAGVEEIGLCDFYVNEYSDRYFSFYSILENGNVIVSSVAYQARQLRGVECYSKGDVLQFTSVVNDNYSVMVILADNHESRLLLVDSTGVEISNTRILANNIKQFVVTRESDDVMMLYTLDHDGNLYRDILKSLLAGNANGLTTVQTDDDIDRLVVEHNQPFLRYVTTDGQLVTYVSIFGSSTGVTIGENVRLADGETS